MRFLLFLWLAVLACGVFSSCSKFETKEQCLDSCFCTWFESDSDPSECRWRCDGDRVTTWCTRNDSLYCNAPIMAVAFLMVICIFLLPFVGLGVVFVVGAGLLELFIMMIKYEWFQVVTTLAVLCVVMVGLCVFVAAAVAACGVVIWVIVLYVPLFTSFF